MKNTFVYGVLATLTVAASPVAAQTVINVEARNAANPSAPSPAVTQTFGPGSYDVKLVGKAGGGTYDAYSFATPAPGNYKADYAYTINGATTAVTPFNGQRFTDAATALAAYAGVVSSFTLDKSTDVSFFIPDTQYWDNLDGISLGVSSPASVPEPGTMALFGLAGGALLASRRRKKAAVA